MDSNGFIKELLSLINRYNELSSELSTAKQAWLKSESGGHDEQLADETIRSISAQLEPVMEDITYLKRRIFSESNGWGGNFANYIQFGGTLIDVNFKNLQSVANEIDYSFKSFAEQNRIVFIFEKDEEDEDGLPVQIAINFIIEHSFLRSYVYPIGYEVKDDEIKTAILKEINKYNEDTRVLKAYVDSDGSVCLERQDFIDSGFTKEHLKNVLDYVFKSAGDFYKRRSKTFVEFVKSNDKNKK